MNPSDPSLLISYQAAPQDGGLLSMLPMMVAIAAIFYFIVYRPQKKEQEAHAKLLASLQRGDRVVTAGGLHGKVHELKGETIVIEAGPNVYLTFEREIIRRKLDAPAAAGEAPKTEGAKA